jgi:hypothetical protein
MKSHYLPFLPISLLAILLWIAQMDWFTAQKCDVPSRDAMHRVSNYTQNIHHMGQVCSQRFCAWFFRYRATLFYG